MSSKRLAALGLAAGLVGGGTAGAALGLAAMSGAQESTTTTEAPATDTPATEAPADGATRPDPGARLSESLQGLVDDGTLTEAQRDAVVDTLKAAGPVGGGRGGHGGPGHGPGRGPGLEAAAGALGMTTDELRDALDEDTSIADVAGEKGVDVQTVIDAIIAEQKTHLDEKVAAGDITQEQADERLANAEERVTAMVNGERPEPPADAPKPVDPEADTDDSGN